MQNVLNTHRLIIRNAQLSELTDLMRVGHSWEDKHITEGDAFTEDYFIKSITEGDLPPIPNATSDNYRSWSIIKKDTMELIGFMETYMGYPNDDTLWIGMFLIDSEHQRHNYGQEVIENLNTMFENQNIEKIGVGVSLKNWKGLRFWHKMGFNSLFSVTGDSNYSDETHAFIGLTKMCL